MRITMRSRKSSKLQCLATYTMWYLCFPIIFARAAQRLESGPEQFTSGAFLEYRRDGENAPSSGPTITAAPSSSQSPTSTPTVSLAPSDVPTESPAPSPSPSEAPTMVPTSTVPPTGAPSSIPTESPAPSPSPSLAPTNRPSESPSDFPTLSPSVSPMPSSQPSDSPSDFPSASPTREPSSRPSISTAPSDMPSAYPSLAPSAFPSDSPSNSPTISSAPSRSPSQAPTQLPSVSPSVFPSDSPSNLPSASPTNLPSESPSAAPSVSSAPTTSAPSTSPSSSPTEESFKTKTVTTIVTLPDIDQNMTSSALAELEITTLGFVRDTQIAHPDYTIDMMAITVLKEQVLYNITMEQTDEAVATALEVTFRIVGVVTDGVAPKDFNFSDVVDPGFDSYFGEFLYRLSIAEDFFAPLSKHIDTTTLIPMPALAPDDNASSKKAQFVATVMFATIALTIALAATIFAVRRHLRKEGDLVKVQQQQLEYPGFGTKTLSDDPESHDEENQTNNHEAREEQQHLDDDVLSDLSRTITPPPTGKAHTERVGTDAMTLQLNIIDDEEIEMEDIGLTPLSGPVGYRTSFSSPPKQASRFPNHGAKDQRGDDDGGTFMDLRRSSLGRTFVMKKWLTPRKSSPMKMHVESTTEGAAEGGTERTNLLKKSRKSIDPDAIKATSTMPPDSKRELSKSELPPTNNKAKATTGASPNHQSMGGNHHRRAPSTDKTPLAIPMNFFGRNGDARSDATSNNVDSVIRGSTTSSFFTKMAGRKNAVFAGRPSLTSDVDFEYQPNSGNTYTYKFGSTQPQSDSFNLNEQNLATLQTNSNDNVEATIPDNRSDFERKRAIFESLSSSPTTNVPTNDKRNIHEPPPTGEGGGDSKRLAGAQSFEVDSVYSDQSELDLNELGIETTLGAYPPQYGNNDTPLSKGSFVEEHHYGSRPTNLHDDSTTYRSDKFPFQTRKNAPASGSTDPSVARSMMASAEEKRRISLSTAIKLGNTYDVFAPPGPIGIVVDTSKMGPAVHSLKSTSPMLGLVNPGDLIIALDDEDTRNMTAASLTRLMAKKSRQRERKITLLSPDGF